MTRLRTIDPFPYRLWLKLLQEHRGNEHIEEMLYWANNAKEHIGRLEYERAGTTWDRDRLKAENEFMIKWINSRIQDRFKEP